MTIRPYNPQDGPALERMALTSGFPYENPESPLIEACLVAESEGNIIAAVAAKRIVELYFWKGEDVSPLRSKLVLNQMHESMATELRKLKYTEANAFIPPTICERFGRRLMRSWGWVRNWPSFAVKF